MAEPALYDQPPGVRWDQMLADPTAAPRTATATVAWSSRERAWFVSVDDGSPGPWRLPALQDDLAKVLDHLMLAVCDEWDIAGQVIVESAGAQLAVPLVRTYYGRNLDEARQAYHGRGIDRDSVHDAYLAMVVQAVVSTGLPIYNLRIEHGELRAGQFTIGTPAIDFDDAAGWLPRAPGRWIAGSPAPMPPPATHVIQWVDSDGWLYIDYSQPSYDVRVTRLADRLDRMALPQDVARVLTQRFPITWAAEPVSWQPPAGYTTDPMVIGWAPSAALERCLLAYVRPDRHAG